MRQRHRIALVLGGFLAAAGLRLWAQGAGEQATLIDLDRQIQEASTNGNAELLERHMAEDFLFTHFGGGTDQKAQWVRRARMTPRPYLRRAASEQTVEAHGDVALVLGRLDVQALSSSQPGKPACYALRYLHVYGKREGRWMFLSHHTTQMIEESHPCP